jgi:hypothetical protein
MTSIESVNALRKGGQMELRIVRAEESGADAAPARLEFLPLCTLEKRASVKTGVGERPPPAGPDPPSLTRAA